MPEKVAEAVVRKDVKTFLGPATGELIRIIMPFDEPQRSHDPVGRQGGGYRGFRGGLLARTRRRHSAVLEPGLSGRQFDETWTRSPDPAQAIVNLRLRRKRLFWNTRDSWVECLAFRSAARPEWFSPAVSRTGLSCS